MPSLRPVLLVRIKTNRFSRITMAILMMLLSTKIVRPLANMMGHAIAPGARIGFSWVYCPKLVMAPGSYIGHFNVILIKRLVIRALGGIGHMNICHGPLSLRLGEGAGLGNRIVTSRARRGVTYGPAQLWLGRGSKITATHSLDCTRSIRFGDYSTLAGKGSQIWTHGYVHEREAPNRYRVDGSVKIGNNVYLGSGVIVTGGVKICDGATVGVGSCVTKSLTEQCFYVSCALRKLPKPVDPETRDDLEQVTAPDLIETVFMKHDAGS